MVCNIVNVCIGFNVVFEMAEGIFDTYFHYVFNIFNYFITKELFTNEKI